MRVAQQNIIPTATKARNLGEIIELFDTVSATTTLAPGDRVTASIISATIDNIRLIAAHDITLYQTSVAANNKIPGGSNVTATDYQLIGPWNDYQATDGNNTVSKIFIHNVTNATKALTEQVSASANDGGITSSSTWSYTGTNVLIGRSATPNDLTAAVRFTNVTIPNSATINSAHLTFTAQTTKTATVKTNIYGIAEDNTADFTSDPTGRTKTTHSAAWNISSEITDSAYDTADISSPLQDIINRTGWSSGNALGFLIVNNGSADNNFLFFYTYDGSTTGACSLTVSYTPVGTSHTVIIQVQSRVITNSVSA